MQKIHTKLTQKYPKYHDWHQTKHHNKIHWGVLVVFTLLVFGTISRWTPISFAADIAAPTTPTNLTATAISSTQINLSWTVSTDNVGVAGYKIYRCAGLTCGPTTPIATSATNSYSDTGLTASTAYTYAVLAYDAAGNNSNQSTLASATTLTSTNPINNLKPGEWYEVPNSYLSDVGYQWPDDAVSTKNGVGLRGIIDMWSGGAFDTKRDRLIVWGGGHAAYAGNEIYAFDLNTLTWKRINDPSLDTDPDGLIESSGEYPDGNPRSRHTYNYIQYVASIDKFCTFGGATMFPSASISTDKTHCFNFDTKQWERMAPATSYKTGAFSAVDPVTGHIWVRGNGDKNYLSEFDPLNNTWTVRSKIESNKVMYDWTAAIDPVRRKFVAIGGGAVFSWDIGTSGIITRQELITTGATEIINARDPGFAYDLVSDKFVAWNGGADVYTLDMDTLVWTKHAPAPTNTVIPTPATGNGTYGRFRYSPNKNVFIVVNSIDQNVYIYRLNPGGGVPQDTTPPTLSSGSPIGALPSGTTQTTLSVSTDENATCKYGTIPNTPYASIANTFSNTGTAVHSQTITGLTKGASYNYYIRCQDTAGNANPTDYAISFSVGISVTETNSITIKEREGKNTTNYPIQFGRPFVQGEIANYPQALIDGIAVETQSNVKSRWSDGSVKHAIISFLIPNLAANTSVRVTFRDQPSGNNDNFVTKEMMLSDNYDFDAAIELTNGLTKAVSARAMLNADAFEYWLKGPIATTVILADHSSARSFDTGFDENRSFRPIFHATFWPGIKKVKVRLIGEIANTEVLQDQTYALSLKTGQQSPETVYTKPVFTHYGNARWTKVFWIGGAPSKVGIDHNLAYLAKTKSIPNYDLNKKVSEAAITDAYSKWTAAPKDIFDSGNWTKYMPTTGGRPEIGMYPTWTVRWLYTGDNRMEEQALGNADLSAAWPVHFREGKETKKFLRNNSVISGLGKVLSVSDRPTINLSDFSFARTVTADKIIPVGLLTKGGWIADNAHQSDPVSPQYILTGDYWYLEELYFWSSWSAANTSGVAITEPWGRGPTGAEGGIYDQVRGQAWVLRSRAHTAFIAPNDVPEKEYFTTLILDALAIWEGERNIGTTPFFGNANWNWGASIKRPALGDPPLHHWDKGETQKAQEGEIDSTVTYTGISTWNQNAMLMSLGRAKELGWPTDALLSYLAFNLIGQLTHPDYNPYLVATYRHPTKRLSDFQFFPTWSELKTGYKSEAQVLASFKLTDAEQGYDFIALAAASMVTGEPGGTDAWQFMEKEALSAGVLNDNPKWALIPRDTSTPPPPPPQDTTPPSIPTSLTAIAVSSSQINLSWNPSTDDVEVAGYNIYRNGTKVATSSTTSYSDTGLVPSTAYSYNVVAYDATGNASVQSASVSATTLALSSNPIDNLKPGEWYEAPNSRLRDVAAVPVPPGWEGVAGVINAWSGGAYDTKRDRLIVWGGGHMSYAGNEIYAFDLNTLKWERVNEPSTDIDTDGSLEWTGEYADGTPRARHTYNYIQYVASIDRFCTFGDTAMYPGGQISTDKTRCFDFNTNQWEKMANTPSYGVGTFSSVDSVTGHAWVRGNGNYRYLSEFDPINNLWTKRTNLESISSMFNWTADIDPVRRKFVAIGGGAVFSWDIGTSGIITRQELITTGATEIINARDPGFAYDLVSDKFVAWNGGADVYTLDMDTLVWTKHAPATTNAVIPTAPAQWGTYGRFRYSSNKNVFVVVNSVDQNVYIYRLNPGGGTPTPTDTISPTTPANLTASPISSSQINLSWTASTDNIGVVGYKIYRCAGLSCAPTTQISTSAVNSYSNTGLTASTAYTYAVSAYDAAGNESGKSSSVSATTLSQFKQADFNKDGVVNQLDFDILKQDWNRTDKPVSDLNQDGVVDSRDLGIMMSEWTR